MITEQDIQKKVGILLTAAGFSVIASEIHEGFPKPAVFVSVYPSSITLAGTDMEDVSDSVEIKYIPGVETTEECAEAAQKIRRTLMYKTFNVCGRHLTIQSMEMDIEEHILYVYFSIDYTQEILHDEEYEPMEELEGGF